MMSAKMASLGSIESSHIKTDRPPGLLNRACQRYLRIPVSILQLAHKRVLSLINAMTSHILSALTSFLFLASASAMMPNCSGSARYSVTFTNSLTPRSFGDLIPADTPIEYSPLTALSHSNRVSVLTLRGFASEAIEAIAETGDNTQLVETVTMLRDGDQGVKTVAVADGPTLPGNLTTLMLDVDCEHPFITVIGMIAPSPDWIVAIANMDLVDSRGRFVRFRAAPLNVYDAGTDDGREFTDPSDLSLDLPSNPQLNIAPLVEDETDRFEGRAVGKYIIKRLRN